LFTKIKNNLNSFLERKVPEKRLFLRTDKETRFVKLTPITQILALIGISTVIIWSIIATAIVLIETIGSGNFRDQARRDQALYEERLNALATERDIRERESIASQNRFNTALSQVSIMQSDLLGSEDMRRELERGINVIHGTLRRAMNEREALRMELELLKKQLNPEIGVLPNAISLAEVSQTMEYMNHTLRGISQQRDNAFDAAELAKKNMESLELEIQFFEEKSDQIFRQLEDALTISVEPLDKMFRNAGLSTKRLLDQVRRGYSGQGGALAPILFQPDVFETEDPRINRANSILIKLDKLNIYRIAVEKTPFDMPVKGSFRYTSGFGPRWGQMHRGVDLAAKSRSPIYATGDGVVTQAGWNGGYGRVVYIKHEFGVETRYAHLARIRVKKGQRVSRGQKIGDMGNSGRSTGTHLHYEVRVDGKAVNPMIFIKAGRDVF
jgi:murein DD-endopeptidase MepM/ murein hydrolase activator NlpD